MITQQFYATLAGSFGARHAAFERLYVAVGSGRAAWDTTPPVYQRDTLALTNEISRKAVAADQIVFIDSQGNRVIGPSPRIVLRVVFDEGEGEGSLRECGLFGGDTDGNAGSGTLLSYFTHARIDKTADMRLQREVVLDFMPRQTGGGQEVTRYLGNSNSQELHDLENETGACQIDEIRFDRRIYFTSTDQALSLDYDRCAYCFGRELSNR